MSIPNNLPVPAALPTQPTVQSNTALSPDQVRSPMPYHKYDQAPLMKNKELKKFKGKKHHTLMPGSAEKQVKLIQDNYSTIKKRKLDFNGNDSTTFNLKDATIEVHKDGKWVVVQDGKRRAFAIELKNSTVQKRLYPLEGTGFTRLSGPEGKSLVENYKKTPQSIPFEEFVKNAVQAVKANP